MLAGEDRGPWSPPKQWVLLGCGIVPQQHSILGGERDEKDPSGLRLILQGKVALVPT